MTALTEFLFPAPARRSARSIFTWWERRRLAWNAITGSAGLLSMGAVNLIGMLPPDAHGPFFPLAAVLVVGLAGNLCYSLGAPVEYAIERLSGGRILPTGPALYRMGLTFSVGLVALPTLIAGFDWAIRIVTRIF